MKIWVQHYSKPVYTLRIDADVDPLNVPTRVIEQLAEIATQCNITIGIMTPIPVEKKSLRTPRA